MKNKTLPDFNSIDALKAIYSELSAPVQSYYKSLIRVILKTGSYITSFVHTDKNNIKLSPKGWHGAKDVQLIQSFEEFTCGSLYAPVSMLGYRQLDYEWALLLKIDCDLARKKTGDIADGISHYISDIVAGDKIIRQRAVLEDLAKKRGRPKKKTNSQDIRERYITSKTSKEDIDEIESWLAEHGDEIDGCTDFDRETTPFKGAIFDKSVSLSSAPENVDEGAFVDWLINGKNNRRKVPVIPEY